MRLTFSELFEIVVPLSFGLGGAFVSLYALGGRVEARRLQRAQFGLAVASLGAAVTAAILAYARAVERRGVHDAAS